MTLLDWDTWKFVHCVHKCEFQRKGTLENFLKDCISCMLSLALPDAIIGNTPFKKSLKGVVQPKGEIMTSLKKI